MSAKVDLLRVFRIKTIIAHLRIVMLIQGVLWVVAGASLLLFPDAEIINTVLMSILGALFIGWGLSINRDKGHANPLPKPLDIEIVHGGQSKKRSLPSTLANDKLRLLK